MIACTTLFQPTRCGKRNIYITVSTTVIDTNRCNALILCYLFFIFLEKIFRSKASSAKYILQKKIIYKDASDLLVPLVPLTSQPNKKNSSKYAGMTYRDLAAEICGSDSDVIIGDDSIPGTSSGAAANSVVGMKSKLQEYEKLFEEAEAAVDWQEAMRAVETSNSASLAIFTKTSL